MAEHIFSSVGKRKESTARVELRSGEGKITVNGRELEDYFGRKTYQIIVKQPLELTSTTNTFNIKITVKGGGLTGQAGAIKHAISRALVKANPKLRKTLKHTGYLTRDPRKVERKKYGRPKARKKFQFSKR